MKKALIGALAAGLFAVPALADTVRMGTEGAYPPYNFINDDGEVDGYEREVGDLLCEIAKLDCTWVKNDWDSIIPNLVGGNYDTIIAGMSITAERDEVIDFTQAYLPPDPSFYVAMAGADANVINGIVAAQTNTIQAGEVAKSGATLVEFASPDETVAAVMNGEADAVLADGAFLQEAVDASNGELVIVEKVLLGGGIGIGVRESDGELKAQFNAAIDTIKADGRLNTLIVKWFSEEQAVY
ncbi:transporter substrate-binding domain-containing protein [Litorivicinus lipolyticus]|uniref:Transporter substrate-binding domain-containing protein n=1 Tax=Litorivicinus lipolyticus TaxID=418701 RepID=A0A5Q2QFN0_9GAMM|nr:transporter substrate-binding domain-containing protein [Litorivicinus lipolyticus]QGG81152.1 transporter substrate-binding domain-containing protein [Litorivicinus lipolyticus]